MLCYEVLLCFLHPSSTQAAFFLVAWQRGRSEPWWIVVWHNKCRQRKLFPCTKKHLNIFQSCQLFIYVGAMCCDMLCWVLTSPANNDLKIWGWRKIMGDVHVLVCWSIAGVVFRPLSDRVWHTDGIFFVLLQCMIDRQSSSCARVDSSVSSLGKPRLGLHPTRSTSIESFSLCYWRQATR